MLELGDRLKCW